MAADGVQLDNKAALRIDPVPNRNSLGNGGVKTKDGGKDAGQCDWNEQQSEEEDEGEVLDSSLGIVEQVREGVDRLNQGKSIECVREEEVANLFLDHHLWHGKK